MLEDTSHFESNAEQDVDQDLYTCIEKYTQTLRSRQNQDPFRYGKDDVRGGRQ